MRRIVGTCAQVLTLCACILLLPSVCLADDAPKRPEWCRPGFVCVPTAEIAADAEYHLDLREQIARYRGSSRRFGFTIGFGLGVGGVVDDDFNVRWVPTGGVMIVWGLRF